MSSLLNRFVLTNAFLNFENLTLKNTPLQKDMHKHIVFNPLSI
jgi:hypothetical protein